MASIYKRKDGKGWRAVVRITNHPTVCDNFDRKEEADWARDTERKIKLGQYSPNRAKEKTVADLIDLYIKDVVTDHHKASKDSIRQLNHFRDSLGKYALAYITPELLLKERRKLSEITTRHNTKLNPATINRYFSTLSGAFRFACKNLRWIDLLCQQLYCKVKRLRVVDLTGLQYQESHGKDISDWLASGNTISDLQAILSKAADYKPACKKNRIRVVTMEEFLSMQLPKREMILSPFLQSQGLCLLYAKRGVGKTHVALGIAYTGGRILKWEAEKPRKVLYVDGEMPAAAMQERLSRIAVSEDSKLPAPDYLRLVTPDLQEGPIPDLSTLEGRAVLKDLSEDSELIVIDNLSCLFRSGVENEAESWQPVQDWALEMRRNGKTIIFVHHAAKGGQQRGTSKKEDILDAVIVLKQPQGYRADQGACFEVNFEKTRHFAGSDAAPFKVQLVEQPDGLWNWEIGEVSSHDDSEVVAS